MQNVTFDLPPIEPTGSPVGGIPQSAMPGYDAPQRGPQPGDDRLYVRFYPKSVLDGAASAREGRPIYHEVDYVRIHVPGDKNLVLDKKVGPEEIARFGPRYEVYRRTKTNAKPDGVPLSEWAAMNRAQVDEYAYLNIHTVEQLAELPDQFGQRVMGFFELRRKAQAYLKQVKDDTYTIKMAEQNDELQRQLAERDKLIAQMGARLEALEKAQAVPATDDVSVPRTRR